MSLASEYYEPIIWRLEDRVAKLEAALKRHAVQGLAPDGLCWCLYIQIVHPQSDPQDSVKLVNGHTDDCWAIRAVLREP